MAACMYAASPQPFMTSAELTLVLPGGLRATPLRAATYHNARALLSESHSQAVPHDQAGNVTRPYNDSAGEPVQQSGYLNAKSVFDWIEAQQASGQIDKRLKSLVVSGCSAGSVGAQLWAVRSCS